MAGKVTRGSATKKIDEILKVVDPGGLIGQMQESVRLRSELLVIGIARMGFGLIRVRETKRTLAREHALYGKGRSAVQCRYANVPVEYHDEQSDIVTWTRPDQSSHVKGLALDLDVGPYTFEEAGSWKRLAYELRFTWGGEWKVMDWGHFEAHA
jgi:hypothetical protein